MIELNDVSKVFSEGKSSFAAVSDVTLSIREGEVFGIVGYSGAGKSTLVRCINLLERPTSGSVTVDGQDLTKLRGRALSEARRKIGMIFQQFNLFSTRTVFDNVAYPIRYSGLSKAELKKRVESLLDFVELGDKRNAYPSQLSGGQKQRVAIARALACDPKVLLCDEATSALDPQTTKSILRLLKRLNRETGITIVMITHQMQVVKEICDRVAVMEKGRVVETGDVLDVFTHPQAPITRSFVDCGQQSGRHIHADGAEPPADAPQAGRADNPAAIPPRQRGRSAGIARVTAVRRGGQHNLRQYRIDRRRAAWLPDSKAFGRRGCGQAGG